MPRKRKKLGPGSITSYKVPVIKGAGSKGFYTWLNKCSSFNGLMTQALKVKFMLDTMKEVEKEVEKANTDFEATLPVDKIESMDSIDIFDDNEDEMLSLSDGIDMKSLRKMMNSIAR